MIELPLHPSVNPNRIYIVGKNGSGKTTIIKEVLRNFEGRKIVITRTPKEYSDIENAEIFTDPDAAIGTVKNAELIAVDLDAFVDLPPTRAVIIMSSQHYDEKMKNGTIIFLRPHPDDLNNLPLSEEGKKFIKRAEPGVGILYNGCETPVRFYT